MPDEELDQLWFDTADNYLKQSNKWMRAITINPIKFKYDSITRPTEVFLYIELVNWKI